MYKKLILLNFWILTLHGLSIKDYLFTQPATISKRMLEHSLDLSGMGLTSLEGLDYLSQFSSIYYLDLKNNNLEIIPSNAFYFLPKLERIDLSHNKIHTIHPLAFNNLNDLMKLNISHNNITTIGVWLGHLYQLTNFDASHNKISSIAPNAFRDQIFLKILLLDANKLQTINPKAFENLKELSRIDLSENPLEQFNEQEEQALEDVLPNHTVIIL